MGGNNRKSSGERSTLLEDHYRILVNHTSDIIFLRDKKGVLVYVTPSIKKHLGYDPGEMIGKTTWKYIHKEDRPKVEVWKKTVLKGEKPFHSIARMRAKNGAYIWLDTQTEIIKDRKGNFKYILSTSRNISEQKREEEEKAWLQEIIEGVVTELYFIDPKTMKFTYCNQKAVENLGYSAEELAGLGPTDLSQNRTKKFFDTLFAPLLDGRQKKVFYQSTNFRKDGSAYDVEITLHGLKTRSKKVIVAIVEDITEKRIAREQLYQAQKMEVVGQLTSGIAHNFNNLLTAILGSLRILEKSEKSKADKEMLEVAIKSAKRGAELTHRLLAFSRKQHLAPTVVNLQQVLNEVESLLVFALGSAIDISVEKLTEELFVKVDPGELENAILNLAINSRDAMPKGGKLSIGVKTQTLKGRGAEILELAAGDYIITEIKDTGVGMTKEILDKVMEPFFTTKEIGEGSGLGLSMVFGFARQSGGALVIESQPGKGTTAKIFLPREP